MFKLISLIFTFGLAFAASSSTAQPKAPDVGPPMRVTIVRGEGPDCPSNCAEWISLEGAFINETPALFRKALKQINGRRPQVLISSGGGVVQAAMDMGRLLRAKGLEVSVARTLFDAAAAEAEAPEKASKSAIAIADGGRPSASGAFCASACTLLLAAGRARHVAPNAHVGLHEMVIPEQDVTQHVRYFQTRTLTRDGKVISKETRTVGEKDLIRRIKRQASSAKDYRMVAAYLDEMGLLSAKAVELMHKAAPEGMAWLSRKSLDDTMLATDAQSPEAVLGLAPKVVAAPALPRETPREAARPTPPQPDVFAAFASRLGLTVGQLVLLLLVTLAMLAAMANSLRRAARLGEGAQRRDPPTLS